jgi:hypothetical protein
MAVSGFVWRSNGLLMPSNKKPRKKYTPRPVLADPIGFVVEAIKPITAHDTYLVDLKLRNHGALTAVLNGSATKRDIDDLIAMHNIQEAIRRMIKQKRITDLPIEMDSSTLIRGKCALLELSSRGFASGRFTPRAPEIQALNDLIQMHDELMYLITVSHMERAIAFARNEIKCKRAEVINACPPR